LLFIFFWSKKGKYMWGPNGPHLVGFVCKIGW